MSMFLTVSYVSDAFLVDTAVPEFFLLSYVEHLRERAGKIRFSDT